MVLFLGKIMLSSPRQTSSVAYVCVLYCLKWWCVFKHFAQYAMLHRTSTQTTHVHTVRPHEVNCRYQSRTKQKQVFQLSELALRNSLARTYNVLYIYVYSTLYKSKVAIYPYQGKRVVISCRVQRQLCTAVILMDLSPWSRE